MNFWLIYDDTKKANIERLIINDKDKIIKNGYRLKIKPMMYANINNNELKLSNTKDKIKWEDISLDIINSKLIMNENLEIEVIGTDKDPYYDLITIDSSELFHKGIKRTLFIEESIENIVFPIIDGIYNNISRNDTLIIETNTNHTLFNDDIKNFLKTTKIDKNIKMYTYGKKSDILSNALQLNEFKIESNLSLKY